MNFEHGGNIWAADRETGLAPKKIIDFSANLNPLGPPPGVLKLLKDKVSYIQFYPEPQAKSLGESFAEKLGLSSEQVIIGNGASELISLFFWVTKPQQVIIPVPTYNDYARAASAAGSKIKNFCFYLQDCSLKKLGKELVRNKSTALVFCNPNNPTGSLWEDVTPLLEAASSKNPLLIDASFLPFTEISWNEWEQRNGFLHFLKENKNLLIIFSLTKIFSLPGLRLGIGLGNPAFIKSLKSARDPWSVNSLAQLAGFECLKEKEYIEKTAETIKKEKEYLFKEIKKISTLKPFPPGANFLLVNCSSTGISAAEITKALAEKGLLIRNAANFPGLDEFYFRVAVKKRNENQLLLSALKLFLDNVN